MTSDYNYELEKKKHGIPFSELFNKTVDDGIWKEFCWENWNKAEIVSKKMSYF